MSDTPRMDARNQLAALEAKTRGRSITETDYFQMRALCQELAEVCDGLRERVRKFEREAEIERERKLRVQLSDDSQRHLDRALAAERQRDEAIAALTRLDCVLDFSEPETITALELPEDLTALKEAFAMAYDALYPQDTARRLLNQKEGT